MGSRPSVAGIGLWLVVLMLGSGQFAPVAQAGPASTERHAREGLAATSNRMQQTAATNAICAQAESETREITQRLVVRRNSVTHLRIGEEFRLSWGVGSPAIQSAAYLVVAVDRLARFSSASAFALTPNARAPFDIGQFKTSTRLIVPLSVPGAPRQGEIVIRPLVAESTQVEIGIVGASACGEVQDPSPSRFTLDVQAGRPEVVLANRFDLAAPDQMIASTNRERLIEVVGSRYRLIERQTGAVLADEAGEAPRFSPTGRFLTARLGNRIQVHDTADGRLISRGTDLSTDAANNDLVWGNNDSFLAGAGQKDGIFLLINPLNDQGGVFASAGLCSVPAGILASINFKIDLERNIAITACRNGRVPANVQSLTGDYTADAAYKSKYGASNDRSLLTFDGWDMVQGTTSTQLSALYGAMRPPVAHTTHLAPIPLPPSERRPGSPPEPFHAASQRESAAYLLDQRRILARLRAFGLEINEGSRFETRLTSGVDEPVQAALLREAKIRVDPKPSAWFEAQQCGEIRIQRDQKNILAPGEQELVVHSLVEADSSLLIVAGRCQIGMHRDLTYSHAALYDSRRPAELFNLRGQAFDKLMFGGISGGYCEMSLYACGFVAELFQGRYLVVSSRRSSAIAIYDLDRRALHRVIYGLPSPELMSHVSLSQDLRHLVKVDRDGSFQLIALPAGQMSLSGHQSDLGQSPLVNQLPILLSGRVSDDEVTVWTPSGRFDTTAEGAAQIAVRFPGRRERFVLEQLSPYLRVADLLPRVMAGERFPATEFGGVPPVLAVKASFSADSIDAQGDGSQFAGLDEVRVYQDGVLTHTLRRSDGSLRPDFSVPRRYGARWITFLALNRSKLFSAPVVFDAGPVRGRRRRIHVIAVGVDHYQDARVPALQNAASDARKFQQSLTALQGTGAYDIASSTLLIDAEASRKTLLDGLAGAMRAAREGDGIILYVAGHGLVGGDGRYYLATSETRIDAIAQTSVPWDDLSRALSQANTRVTVFLDACQSGTAGTSYFATNDSAAKAMLDRVPSGILIFSASKGRELAEEQDAVGGGVFTGALVEALASAETDLNHNGAVEASELYARVKARVVGATQGRQTPWFARNEMLGDMPPF